MRSPSLPTARDDWRRMWWAVRAVLGRPSWLLVGLLATLAALTAFVAFDRPVYLRTVVLGGDLSVAGRLRAIADLAPTMVPGRGLLRGSFLYLTALAVGTNVAMLGYQLRHNRAGVGGGSSSVLGVVFGVLGAGCASCGLAVVASALSLSGVATGLTALPLEGVEFLLLALAVTILSIHWSSAGIATSAVDGCPVDV